MTHSQTEQKPLPDIHKMERDLPLNNNLHSVNGPKYFDFGDTRNFHPCSSVSDMSSESSNLNLHSLKLDNMSLDHDSRISMPTATSVHFLASKGNSVVSLDDDNKLEFSKTDSPRHHHRSQSMSKFVEEGGAAAQIAMRKELNRMVDDKLLLDGGKETHSFLRFRSEMEGFSELFDRYLEQKKGPPLDWNKIRNVDPNKVIPYEKVRKEAERLNSESTEDFKRLAVLKLNGGLGTTMGCIGPKSAIEVRDGMTFLDLTVRQIEYLNSTEGDLDVPLILMNSFNTDDKTQHILQKYSRHKVSIVTFNQSRYPRIGKGSLLPVLHEVSQRRSRTRNVDESRDHHIYGSTNSPEYFTDRSFSPSLGMDSQIAENDAWYPPGHGDLFRSLDKSGLLDDLLANGKDILFVSNVDNLGATVDPSILSYMISNNIAYVMEVTDKTKNDIKGGTLIEYQENGGTCLRLLEIAQVPPEHINDFTSVQKFKIFNTNNIWINLKALRKLLDENSLSLEVIQNVKTLEGTDQKVIQLETAIGSAIQNFPSAIGINVPRQRFLPVKSTSDLFLVQSDLYALSHGQLMMTQGILNKRQFGTIPIIKLGDHFKKVKNYLNRVNQGVPSLIECDHLTVSGDVTFGHNVILKGTVIIVANHGCHIDIPSGAILHDKVVSGNLHILEH